MIPVIYIEKTKKISLFDILVSDIHAGDDYTTIDSSVGLTYHEVWEWISEGGDWAFKVTEHKNHDNIFMVGSTYQSMNSARKGENEIHLTSASEEEIEELHTSFHEKRRKQFGLK